METRYDGLRKVSAMYFTVCLVCPEMLSLLSILSRKTSVFDY